MPSYLEDSYLGGLNEEFAELGAESATSPLSPAPGEEGYTPGNELVTLPGGITMPKRTLWLVGIVALVAIILILRKRDRRARALESRLAEREKIES